MEVGRQENNILEKGEDKREATDRVSSSEIPTDIKNMGFVVIRVPWRISSSMISALWT